MHDGVLPPRSRSFSAMEYPMKKLSKKSLALKSETVRNLRDDAMHMAAGGFRPTDTKYFLCTTIRCDETLP